MMGLLCVGAGGALGAMGRYGLGLIPLGRDVYKRQAPYDAGSTQTVAFSHYNNITMQLPLDPGTGRPILGDVAAQTAPVSYTHLPRGESWAFSSCLAPTPPRIGIPNARALPRSPSPVS